MFRKYNKTAAMAAASFVGDSPMFLLDYVLRFLRVALLLSLWRTILNGRGVVSGMTLGSVLTYTLVAELFAELLACRTELASSFWDGSIATRYLKPMNIFGQFTAEAFGRWGFGLAVFSVPLLLCAPSLGVNPFPPTWSAACLFPVSLSLAVGVGLAIEFIFGAVAVRYALPVYALSRLRDAFGMLLSGSLLPLALLPWNLGVVFGWLPFASVASAPLRLYTGTGEPLPLLGLQALWCLLLWPVALRMWRINQERMVSYGG